MRRERNCSGEEDSGKEEGETHVKFRKLGTVAVPAGGESEPIEEFM